LDSLPFIFLSTLISGVKIMNISGNTVLVTGGATGIGFALAEAFQKAGNRVIICGRRADRLREAQDRLPGIQVFACDVSEEDERHRLVNWLGENAPDLNVLVNNAGIQRDIDFTSGPAALSGPSELRTNLEAPIALAALLVPQLQTRANAAIINVTSGMMFRPSARMPVYSTTKLALHAFSGALREQLAPLGIKVYEAVPPLILDTELNPEGRAKARAADSRPDHVRFAGLVIPTSAEYADSVLQNLENDVPEFGFGMSEESLRLSRLNPRDFKVAGPSLDNEIIDRMISSRRSVRTFKSEVPDRELIAQVVEAGRQAPYAGLANRGSNDFRHFYVIAKDSPVVEKLRTACLSAIREKLAVYEKQNDPRMQNMLQVMRMIAEKGLPPWNAPWLIIVAERKGYPAREVQSLACVLENMWLKTTTLGLGMQLISAINDLEDSMELSEVTGLPAGEYAYDACQIGWPDMPAREKPREEPASSVKWL